VANIVSFNPNITNQQVLKNYYDRPWAVIGSVKALTRLGRSFPALQQPIILPALAKITDEAYTNEILIGLARLSQSNRTIIQQHDTLAAQVTDLFKTSTALLGAKHYEAVLLKLRIARKVVCPHGGMLAAYLQV